MRKDAGVHMTWMTDHAQEIFAAIGAVGVAARLIVALTPSKYDDAVLAKFVQSLAMFYRGGK